MLPYPGDSLLCSRVVDLRSEDSGPQHPYRGFPNALFLRSDMLQFDPAHMQESALPVLLWRERSAARHGQVAVGVAVVYRLRARRGRRDHACSLEVFLDFDIKLRPFLSQLSSVKSGVGIDGAAVNREGVVRFAVDCLVRAELVAVVGHLVDVPGSDLPDVLACGSAFVCASAHTDSVPITYRNARRWRRRCSLSLSRKSGEAGFLRRRSRRHSAKRSKASTESITVTGFFFFIASPPPADCSTTARWLVKRFLRMVPVSAHNSVVPAI